MIEVHLQGQKVNFKVKLLKMSFLTNIIGVILTTLFISNNVLPIQGHIQGQNVNSKVKTVKCCF